jgi:hypothetical protein
MRTFTRAGRGRGRRHGVALLAAIVDGDEHGTGLVRLDGRVLDDRIRPVEHDLHLVGASIELLGGARRGVADLLAVDVDVDLADRLLRLGLHLDRQLARPRNQHEHGEADDCEQGEHAEDDAELGATLTATADRRFVAA